MSGLNPDPKTQNGPQPEPPPTRPGRAWAGVIILLAFLLLGSAGWLAGYAFTPSGRNTESTVLIPRGAGVRKIAAILAQEGLPADDIRFPALARLTGTAGRLRAGEYLIPPRQTPLQILRLLERGEVIRHQVTIPEGLTLVQVADILEKDGWIDRQQFLESASDPELINSLGFIALPNLEGYLFPDTYVLTRGDTTEKNIIVMMVNRFQEVWQALVDQHHPDMPRHAVITLASIVEKETGSAAERPLIARVFLNRLAENMRLQSDPTVIYGLDEFNGNLTRAHLQQENPYNTYVIKGLPPGPICNPGRAAIEAVLEPADAPYLYFVSKNDGTHFFSTTLREHNKAVRQFQKKRRNRP